MKHNSQVCRFRIGEHDKFDLCGGFVIVQFVLAGAVGNKAVVMTILMKAHCWKVLKFVGCAPIVLSANATCKVAQGKDDSEYELRIIFLRQLLPLIGGDIAIAFDTRSRWWSRAFAARGTGLWKPSFRVDTFSSAMSVEWAKEHSVRANTPCLSNM